MAHVLPVSVTAKEAERSVPPLVEKSAGSLLPTPRAEPMAQTVAPPMNGSPVVKAGAPMAMAVLEPSAPEASS